MEFIEFIPLITTAYKVSQTVLYLHRPPIHSICFCFASVLSIYFQAVSSQHGIQQHATEETLRPRQPQGHKTPQAHPKPSSG